MTTLRDNCTPCPDPPKKVAEVLGRLEMRVGMGWEVEYLEDHGVWCIERHHQGRREGCVVSLSDDWAAYTADVFGTWRANWGRPVVAANTSESGTTDDDCPGLVMSRAIDRWKEEIRQEAVEAGYPKADLPRWGKRRRVTRRRRSDVEEPEQGELL